jgi:polysaccharide biosynthesis protein PslH
MKILFLSRWYPYPADNGSKIRIYNLIKYLASYHEVHLVSFATAETTAEDLVAMRPYCQEIEVVRYQSYQPWRWKAMAGFFSPQPRSVIDTYNSEMEQVIEQKTTAQAFDLVIASQVDMAPYAIAIPGIPKIFEEIELTTRYEQFSRQHQPLKRAWSRFSWEKLSRYMARLISQFDGCTVVSKGELTQLRQIVPHYNPISVIPNGVDTSYYSGDFGAPAANTLIYSGALTYKANFDAIDYFLREIFPLIQTQCPSVKLFITGKLQGVPIDQLPRHEGVIFTGYLDDIRPTLAQSSVNIVPLRLGGGTRLKVLESLAIGAPVVATCKGAEGLEVVSQRDLLIADEPAQFAEAVLQLLQDPALRQTLSRNGQKVVRDKYDWQIIGRQFNHFIETVATTPVKAKING